MKYCTLFIVFFLLGFNTGSQTEVEEYRLKAAFIFNFTKFIEWENHDSKVFKIGVIGASPIAASLEEISHTKTVNNKKITIENYNNPDEINDCNILFIPADNKFSLEEILSKTKNKNMLTVSEQSGFARQGTGINFIVLDDKLKFEVNLKALAAARLKVSSQLLKLAVIVE